MVTQHEINRFHQQLSLAQIQYFQLTKNQLQTPCQAEKQNTKSPGHAVQTEANDGFTDNNPGSLFHNDEIRNLGGGDIPRSITLDKATGEQQPGVLVCASSAQCAAPLSKGPQYPYPLSLRSAVLSPTCVPDVCAWLSCLARTLHP